MKRRRFIPVVAAIAGSLIAVGGLSGCSTQASKSGPITISVYEYQQLRSDTTAKLIPKFEAAMAKQGQDIKVKLVKDVLTDQQFQTKVTQEYHAGTAPDVVDMGSSFVDGFAGAGYLLPLNSYLSKWSGWKSFYPVVKTAMKAPDGQTYAIPHETSVQGLFYRKDVLQKLGISTAQPATWADLIDRLKQITAKTGSPSLILPAGTAWGDGTFAQGFGNIASGTSSLYDTATKKWVVKNSGLDSTFALYQELIKDNVIPVQDLLNPNPWEPTKYKAFVDGTMPVSEQGTWGWKYDWGPQGSAPIAGLTQKVATWNFPALKAGGKTYSTLSVGNVFAVSKTTKHAQAAVEFSEWMSSGAALADQLTAVGAAAPRTGIEKVAPYSKDPQLLTAQKDVAGAVIVPAEDGEAQYSQAVQNATEDQLTGKVTASQAAAEFASQATDLLGKSRVKG